MGITHSVIPGCDIHPVGPQLCSLHHAFIVTTIIGSLHICPEDQLCLSRIHPIITMRTKPFVHLRLPVCQRPALFHRCSQLVQKLLQHFCRGIAGNCKRLRLCTIAQGCIFFFCQDAFLFQKGNCVFEDQLRKSLQVFCTAHPSLLPISSAK